MSDGEPPEDEDGEGPTDGLPVDDLLPPPPEEEEEEEGTDADHGPTSGPDDGIGSPGGPAEGPSRPGDEPGGPGEGSGGPGEPSDGRVGPDRPSDDDADADRSDLFSSVDDDPFSREGDATDDDAPMDGLAEAARERQRQGDDDLMDAFQEVDVGDVDEETLWEQLADEDIEETVDEPRGSTERDVRVVEKREYCMRCQYFSAPPEVRCTHERGEIREVVDSEQFEVADCPILRGEEELENLRR